MKCRYLVSALVEGYRQYLAVEDGEALLVERLEHAWSTASAAAANETLRICRQAYPHIEWSIERKDGR